MYAIGLKNIEVSDIELNIKEKIYAIDAFKLIEEKYNTSENFFIMGADNFINLIKWKNSEELIKKYKYIVLGRENINIERNISENLKDKVFIINNKIYNNCSSSKFRDIIKQEKSYNQDMVPDEVLDYIIKNNLF